MKQIIKWAFIVIFTGFSTGGASGSGLEIEALYQQAREQTRYITPDQKTLDEAEALFFNIFSGSPEAREKAVQLHFEMKTVMNEARQYIVLHEHSDYRTGRGFYLFPADSSECRKILELPHSFRDLFTGDIGLKIALERRFAGIAWNTVPRYYTIDGKRREADLSDLTDTWLAAFTRAFIKHRSDGYVIQLHGFSQKKRTSKSGEEANVILSNGTSAPPPWIKQLDACLETKYKRPIVYYPFEVKELGATRTSIGIIMRRMKSDRFLHIELSKPFRIEMKDQPEHRNRLVDCFDSILQ